MEREHDTPMLLAVRVAELHLHAIGHDDLREVVQDLQQLHVFPGRPNLSCGAILPLGPERTSRFLDYFFAPDVDQAWIDELLAFDDQIGREDTALVEGVQRGVRSGVVPEGRLLSESEQLVAHFQRLCAEALAE